MIYAHKKNESYEKSYESPDCKIVVTTTDFDLLQISAEKGDPKHGGEDTFSKSNPFGYEEDNDTKGTKGWN